MPIRSDIEKIVGKDLFAAYIGHKEQGRKDLYAAQGGPAEDAQLVKNIKSDGRKYVVVSSLPGKGEIGIIKDYQARCLDGHSDYFVVNNHNLAHYDITKVSPPDNDLPIEASGNDDACGGFSIMQILANDPNTSSRLDAIVNGMPDAANRAVAGNAILTQDSAVINNLDPKIVRQFISSAVLNSNDPQKNNRSKQILTSRYRLVSEDINSALDGLGIKHIERSVLGRVANGGLEVDVRNIGVEAVQSLAGKRGEGDRFHNTRHYQNDNFNIELRELKAFLTLQGVEDAELDRIEKDLKEYKERLSRVAPQAAAFGGGVHNSGRSAYSKGKEIKKSDKKDGPSNEKDASTLKEHMATNVKDEDEKKHEKKATSSNKQNSSQIKLFWEQCLEEARKEDHIMRSLTEKPTIWTAQGGTVIQNKKSPTFVEYEPDRGLSLWDDTLTKSRKIETDVDRGIRMSPLMKIKGQDGYYMQIADNKKSFVVEVSGRDNLNLIDRAGDGFYNIFAKELENQKNSGRTINEKLVSDILSSYRDGPPPSFGPISHSTLSSGVRVR